MSIRRSPTGSPSTWTLRTPGCRASERHRLESQSLQRHQRDVVLLFPVWAGDTFELGHERFDQVVLATTVGHDLDDPREAKHVCLGALGLGEAIAVQEQARSRWDHRVLQLV